MMRNINGQASMEFLVTLGIVLLIFILALLFSHLKMSEINAYKTQLDVERICKSVAYNIDTIAALDDGFYLYFSIPEKILGGYDYNIMTYYNFVEIYGDFPMSPWNIQITTNDTRICCDGSCSSLGNPRRLSKGLDKKNKVYKENGSVYIICYMPELRILKGTILPRYADDVTPINLTFEIENFGPVDANSSFVVYINKTGSPLEQYVIVPRLAADSSYFISVNFSAPAWGNYTVYLDLYDNVSESIETNNEYGFEIKRWV